MYEFHHMQQLDWMVFICWLEEIFERNSCRIINITSEQTT